jgi:hypothetical protein
MSGWFLRNVYDVCSDYVVDLALGNLVAWTHSVRGLEGAVQLFIINLSM